MNRGTRIKDDTLKEIYQALLKMQKTLNRLEKRYERSAAHDRKHNPTRSVTDGTIIRYKDEKATAWSDFERALKNTLLAVKKRLPRE